MKRTQWLLVFLLHQLPPTSPVRAPAVAALAVELAQRMQATEEERRARS